MVKSNVVELFPEPAPVIRGDVSDVLSSIIDWADRQGVNTQTEKFRYESATIATLLQVMAMNS